MHIPNIGIFTHNFFLPIERKLKAKPGECEQAVKDAIDAGYRHIDTAFLYGTEKEVGNGIRAKINEGVIRREDIFVVTKVNSVMEQSGSEKFSKQKNFFQVVEHLPQT